MPEDRRIQKLRDGPTILRATAAEVPKYTDCGPLIDEMLRVMKANNGMGLAAPQIGVSLRVIVGDQEQDGWHFELINPTVKKVTGKIRHHEEGCLSCPGTIKNRVMVPRYKHIQVRGWSRDWEQITVTGRLWLGWCLQHELDHLDGKCIDRFTKARRSA